MDFINKIFKAKAQNRDEEGNVTAVNNQDEEDESNSSHKSNNDSQNVPTDTINRKKKRTLAFYEEKYRQQKQHPGLATILPAPDMPNESQENMTLKKGHKNVTSLNIASVKSGPDRIMTLVEGKNIILEEFDPLWTGEVKLMKTSENSDFTDSLKIPNKPRRNKINNEKLLLAEHKPVIRVAKMESIPENEVIVEELIKDIPKDGNDKQILAKANVSYEGLEGVFARPVINDNYEVINEGVFPSTSSSDTFQSVPHSDIFPSTSNSAVPPVFLQPRKNPWNIWPGLFEDNLALQTKDPGMSKVGDALKKKFENFVSDSKPIDSLEYLFYQATDEKEDKSHKMISEFFAEEARPVTDEDIDKYSRKIEISKIEVYEEDIKRYHQSLKYRRGPVDHDIIFTTVETALNFIEKLAKDREEKKKVSCLPELLEKCLKGKATRQNEEDKEKEKNKKKDPLKPKMWLVFNRTSKEKVIICTPGEFYDSDNE